VTLTMFLLANSTLSLGSGID